MSPPFLRVVLLALGLVGAFVGIGELVTRISGEAERRASLAGGSGPIGPETGEAIFWGKGKCSTCHAVGRRGGSIRGPDQGESGPLGLAIGARAEARARERMRATGRPYTPTDYLVESLVAPEAYVVAGYKNEMPNPLRPPVKLTPGELRAVVEYLQSLGGTVDPGAVRLPASALAAVAPAEDLKPYLPGDPKKGETLFFAADSPAACGKCHRAGQRGGAVGPDLSGIAGTRDARFIIESILEPSKQIASGFEPILIVTTDDRYVTGIVRTEDARGVEVVDGEGRVTRVARARIRQRVPQQTSLMPENFREILTVEEFHDLLAFLLTLK